MIRLLSLILLLLLSLLTVFRAPAYPFWIAAIFVAEYCWVFILLTLVLLIAGIWAKHYQIASIIIGVLAIGFLAVPLIDAYKISGRLPDDLTKAFDSADKNPTTAFSFAKMFVKSPTVPYQTFTYSTYKKPNPDSNGTDALTLDYYHAQQAGKRPCVVVIHGGSWSSGDSRQLPELNSVLAKAGYNVASINYRLAPAFKNPAPAEDTQHALHYLKAHADSLGIDTTQFILLGRSAGGQVALLAAYAGRDADVKGVIDFYGPADMVWGYSVPANPLVFDSRRIMERYLGGKYGQMPEKYKASSPIEYVDAHTVPTLIIHGQNDVLVAYEHSIRLNAKLQQYGVKHYLLTLPWATHGFDYHLNGPGGQLSTYAVLRFLQAVTH